MPIPFETVHIEQLQDAKRLLEHPGIAARLSSSLATPVDRAIRRLPASASKIIMAAVTRSLEAALRTALYTLGEGPQPPSNRIHLATAALSGAAGGAFGLAALAIELPVSTTIMLRSIADIARGEGENLAHAESRLACLEVFALGGASDQDDAAESGYFGIRAALASAITEAARHLATQGAAREGTPALVRLVTQIAARFSIPVTQKAAAQAVPIIGAAGGALINSLFIGHFQDIARGHFTVRRLERIYGPEQVRALYDTLP
ncbi:EcsC family protein [Marinobacterium rhizophilum]|uniref:EcsC family protein n=1 Tax=Marinobacterium rhizophilum TaxID=420402 RepID=A0ABY5HL80_9GAMM|nr:EcsC family protein [Marinobacterium rhizophilum]UTW12562.1 EcsC family protein [Marinobacterium rhizophilum]